MHFVTFLRPFSVTPYLFSIGEIFCMSARLKAAAHVDVRPSVLVTVKPYPVQMVLPCKVRSIAQPNW